MQHSQSVVLVLRLTRSVSDEDVLPLARQQFFRLQVEVVRQGHQ